MIILEKSENLIDSLLGKSGKRVTIEPAINEVIPDKADTSSEAKNNKLAHCFGKPVFI
ncbi:MAG: hypothetical protein U7123_23515 [Potamolinea sp.]